MYCHQQILVIYNINKTIRNLRKDINKEKFEKGDKFITKSPWASFTHTPKNNLDKKIDVISQN